MALFLYNIVYVTKVNLIVDLRIIMDNVPYFKYYLRLNLSSTLLVSLI